MKRLVVLAVFLIGTLGVSACQELRETPAEGSVQLVDWSADTIENFARLP